MAVRVAFACSIASFLQGCGRRPAVTPGPATSQVVAHVQNRWLQVRLSRPDADRDQRPLVLFVTGDGGWRGKDLHTFDHLTRWGYSVAGFSAPEYLDHLAKGAQSLSPSELARDFRAIFDASCKGLHLAAETPVLLTGVSRGADLVVIAAADPLLQGTVVGTLAVALTDEEEFVRHPRGMFHRASAPPAATAVQAGTGPDEQVIADPYEVLPWIRTPVCLIQSTRDQYIPAASARERFGPESPTRRFHAIAARNHSFGGARDALYEAMRASLAWLSSPRSATNAASGP